MKLTRRGLLGGVGAVALAKASGLPVGTSAHALATDENGLHVQDWFLESFLDLRDDIKESAASGKHLAIMWEQRGCPYCREMHRVNFANPVMRDYIKKNFNIVQLNYRGSRKVTDFDGKEMGERQLALRWRVNFTPTMNFYPMDIAQINGKVGREAEVFRMPGYFKPFHFLSAFEYVRSKRTKEISFQNFLSEKGKKQRADGKTSEMWD